MAARPIRCQACNALAFVVAGVFPAKCPNERCHCEGWWRIDWLAELDDDPMFDAADKRMLGGMNISPK